MKEYGVLNPTVVKKCKNLGCKLIMPGGSRFICQPKVVVDGTVPYAEQDRLIRIGQDFGTQIPDNCPENYDNTP